MAKSSDKNAQTPDNIAEIATQRANLDRVALIGIFGSEASPSALVRAGNGDFARVNVGDSFNGGIVAGIGADTLILAQRGKTKVMKLPKA